MTNVSGRNPWELEHGKPDRSVEKSNSDEIQKDAGKPNHDESENDSWTLEEGRESDRLYSPNITADIPKDQWKGYVLQATKEAIHISETRGQVYMLVRKWDNDNEPQAPALDLARLTEWAIETWAPHLK